MLDRVVSSVTQSCWWWSILISAVAWLIIIAAIPPSAQNFPLGDDWAFARGAILFAQGHGINYSNWASMPQLGQWLWAFPFLKIFGTSHFVLRCSTIVISWLGLVSFYHLLRNEKISPPIAGFACCVLAMNPLFFVSQGTFMTDVPALSFGLMALHCYANAVKRQTMFWLLAAFFVASLGVMTRQTLIAIPLIAGLMLCRLPDVRQRSLWAMATVMPVVIGALTHIWFMQRPDIIPMAAILPALEDGLLRPFVTIHLCGLACLPLFMVVSPSLNWKLFMMLLAALLCFCGGVLFFEQKLTIFTGAFPYSAGMISIYGAFSGDLVMGTREVLLTPSGRIFISFAGCFGGAAVLASLGSFIREGQRSNLLVLFSVIQLLLLLVLPSFYDRYTDILFPGALYLVARMGSAKRLRWLPGIAALLVYALVSVGLVQDWLSWNAARWELGKRALAMSIEPMMIEGGFEWNGWFSVNSNNPDAAISSSPVGAMLLPFTREHFPLIKGQYALASSQPADSVVFASTQYRSWLAGTNTFLLVQSNNKSTGGTAR